MAAGSHGHVAASEGSSDPNAESRQRIVLAADRQFRLYGFAKTTMAEIAAAAEMSPANLYRFFKGKDEIVEAIARLWMGEAEAQALAISHRPDPAPARFRAFVLETLALVRTRRVHERHVHQLVVWVCENRFHIVEGHKRAMLGILTRIIADGMAEGSFAPGDAEGRAGAAYDCMVKFQHPLVVAQCEGEPLEDQARAVAELLIGGLATPMPAAS